MATGVVRRHSRKCESRKGQRCSCAAGYEAWVYAPGEGGKVRKCFQRKSEAQAWRSKAQDEVRKGLLAPPKRNPHGLVVALENLLEGMREGTVRPRNRDRYKPATIRNYEQHIRRRIGPTLLGSMKMRDVRRLDVQEFVDELLAEGLAPSTVNNILNPIQVLYRRACIRDELFYNPTAQIEVPNARSTRPKRIASHEEAAELVAVLPAEERPIWATAFYAGLRRGELQGLRCSDIDLERHTITVERGWDQYEGPIPPKSKASYRTVPILAPLREMLAAHLVRTRRSGEELIFGRTEAAAFVSSTVNYHAQDRWECEGLQSITMHECRHTFASLLIDAGANPKALQAFMGHSNIQVTFDTYGHLLPGSREEVRRLMDRYLAYEDKFGGSSGPTGLAHGADIPGAPGSKMLAHLAHRQNQQSGGLPFGGFEPGANPFTER
jgi:integrase